MFLWLEPWSMWLLIGILCIGAELLIPGLVVIFFGFGAILTALFSLLPLIQDRLWIQILIFLVFSILSIVFLRKKFTPIFKGSVFLPNKQADSEVDAYALVLESLSEKKEGRIKYKGTTWNAISVSGEIPEGARVKVVRQEGLTYIVAQ